MFDDTIRWFHLLAAATWVGGMITVGALVPVLRTTGATPEQIKAVARRFGNLAWVALGVSVLTGITQLTRLDLELDRSTAFAVKLALVGLAATLAWVHQITAATTRPALRGAIQGVLLIDGLAIIAAAIAL